MLAIVYVVCLGYLDPTLKTAVSFGLPRRFQGRVWGFMFFLQGLATIAGSFLARFYDAQSDYTAQLASALLCFAAALLEIERRLQS